jgi:uncharacterized protein (DUF1697 family)
VSKTSPPKPSSKKAPTFIALLRGVNVVGKNRLPMKELAPLFEEAGAADVRTYIQSGNVLFTAAPSRVAGIPSLVSKAILDRFGFEPKILLRSAAELQAVASRNPFLLAGKDPAWLHVVFLADAPPAAAVARLDPARSPPDAFEVRGREVFLFLPNGMGRTKLGTDYLERTLATPCSARNWRTVLTLVELAQG